MLGAGFDERSGIETDAEDRFIVKTNHLVSSPAPVPITCSSVEQLLEGLPLGKRSRSNYHSDVQWLVTFGVLEQHLVLSENLPDQPSCLSSRAVLGVDGSEQDAPASD